MNVDAGTVRPAGPQDGPLLKDLFEQAVRSSYPDLASLTRSEVRERIESQWAWYAEQGGHVRVFQRRDGRVAGCCWSLPSHHPVTGLAELFIVVLAVRPEDRGQGIGHLLLEDARTLAARSGMKRLRLFTHVDNTPARALYRRTGFKEATVELVLEEDQEARERG